MARGRVKASSNLSGKKSRPALFPETREKQLIALAMDLAEEHLRNGTASSQLITEFVKRGSTKSQKEIEKLEEENKLLREKTESLKAAGDTAKMYKDAIAAFGIYSGHGREDDDEDDYDEDY